MAPKVKAGAKAAGKAKAVAKAASPEPVPKAAPEKLSVFDAETNLNFVEDDDWAQLAEHPSDTAKQVLEAVLLLMGDPDTSWDNAAVALQKPEVCGGAKNILVLYSCLNSNPHPQVPSISARLSDTSHVIYVYFRKHVPIGVFFHFFLPFFPIADRSISWPF